jgi:hypothetical protein
MFMDYASHISSDAMTNLLSLIKIGPIIPNLKERLFAETQLGFLMKILKFFSNKDSRLKKQRMFYESSSKTVI